MIHFFIYMIYFLCILQKVSIILFWWSINQTFALMAKSEGQYLQ